MTRGLKKALDGLQKHKEHRQMQLQATKSAIMFRQYRALRGLLCAAEENIKRHEQARQRHRIISCQRCFSQWQALSQHSREVRECEDWVFRGDLIGEDANTATSEKIQLQGLNKLNVEPFTRPAPRIPSPIRSYAAEQLHNTRQRQSKEAEIHLAIEVEMQKICQGQQKFRKNVERLHYLRKKLKSVVEEPAGGFSSQMAVDQGEVEYLEGVCARYLSESTVRKSQLEQLQRELVSNSQENNELDMRFLVYND